LKAKGAPSTPLTEGRAMYLGRFFKNLRIRNKLLVSFITLFIPLASLGTIIVYLQVKQAIEDNIESELTNTTASLLKMIQASATVSIKNHLRAIAEKNLEIAAYIYNQSLKGEIDRETAIQRTREILLNQVIGRTGYIYCLNSDGNVVLHPHKDVEGTNVSQHTFVQKQLLLKNGYLEYNWKNPGEIRQRPKALYMTYFTPLDWIISVSSYREEFYNLLNVDDFSEGILSLKYGKSGYAFLIDDKGESVIHPATPGEAAADDITLPKHIILEMLKLKTGKLTFDWRNSGDDSIRQRMVFFNSIPEYQWIVASSTFTDEIFSPLYQVRNLIIAALLAALLLASFLTFIISASITKPLVALQNRFAAGAQGDFSVRMQHEAQDEIGKLTNYFNTFMDRLESYQRELRAEIKERRQTETALRESEKNYRSLYDKSKQEEELYVSLLNASPDAIVVYNMQGEVKYLNPAFTDIFGWCFEELKGRRIPFVPDSEMEASMKIVFDLIEHGTPCSGFETKRLTKDARTIDISISGSRYHDSVGNPSGMLSILRDISETKKLEAQVQHAQRMEAIGTLAGGIAHDFNNLLMGIQGRTSLLLSEVQPHDPGYDHLKEIEAHVVASTDLTRQLLGFARGGKYQVKPLSVNAIVAKTTSMFGRTRKEIKIDHDMASDIWNTEADQSQIEQVLLNLYVNAWQAMPDGGHLHISTVNCEIDREFAQSLNLEEGRYVCIKVADTGIGMDEETQLRIFDPFFTTKERSRGTGLGLSSAYGIIRNHGGIITVDSTIGRGSTFLLYLPASDQPLLDEAIEEDLVLMGTGTVLLVDDEKIILDVGQALLQKIGYKVIVARNGQEALEMYRRHQSQIDVVILDMIMPEMAGDVTYEYLKALDNKVKVLLSSGYSIDGHAQRIMDKGCNGFLQKPFNIKELSQKLKSICEQR
jgi:PAS domain S-box-containing protein